MLIKSWKSQHDFLLILVFTEDMQCTSIYFRYSAVVIFWKSLLKLHKFCSREKSLKTDWLLSFYNRHISSIRKSRRQALSLKKPCAVASPLQYLELPPWIWLIMHWSMNLHACDDPTKALTMTAIENKIFFKHSVLNSPS